MGEAIDGMDMIKKIEGVGSQRGRISKKVVIAECGIFPDGLMEFIIRLELNVTEGMSVPCQMLGLATSEGNGDSPEPPTSRQRVLDMIEKIVTERTQYKRLLESRDQKSEIALDILQKIMKTCQKASGAQS